MSTGYLQYKPFAARVGDAIVAHDGQALHALLAPWLQQRMRPSELEAQLKEHLERYSAENWKGAPLGYFDRYAVGGNDLTWAQLDIEGSPASRNVSSENFRAWMKLALKGPEEAPLFVSPVADLWFAVVEVEGQLRVGYYEIVDAD